MPAPATPLLDLDLLLTEPERATADRVAALAAPWRTSIAGWFAASDPPVRQIAAELGSAGLLGMSLPQPFGSAAGAVGYGMACLEVEAVDSGLRSLLSVQGSLAMHAIHAYGSPEQAQQWLPGMARGELIGGFALTEPAAGSNPAECRTTAVRSEAGWLLNGSKKWITNGPVGDVVVTWAMTDEGMRGFLVPVGADGVTMREVPERLSLRASRCGEMELAGVQVGEEHRLPGARGLKAPLSCLNEARFGIIFGTLGAARDSLLSALDYTIGREQFGKPLAGFQLVQAELADMAAELAAAFALAVHLGRIKDAGRITPAQVSLGKRTSAATALSIARRARALHGANGVLLEHSPMRHAANLESVITYEGTHEMHTLVLGQELTGVAAFR
jgi:glutaryl-CoA dehydrogenase